MRYLSRLILLFAGLLPAHAAQADILVAAASSVREPLDRIAASFERDSGLRVSVSYGSSGNLAHQVLRGAPYQVFLSADTDYPERIWRDGRDLERPRLYARGSLRIYANEDSSCEPDAGIDGLVEQVESGRIRRIAIARPVLAPYGRATEQALRSAGAWERLSAYLAIGNNVAQAAQFGFSGAADCAFISTSLAQSPALARRGRSAPVDARLYAPVRHAMILLDRADADAARFFRYLSTADALRLFAEGGLQGPGD